MYTNLKCAMEREKCTPHMIARMLLIDVQSAMDKLSARVPFLYDEVILLHEMYFPLYDINWLFRKDRGEPI